MFITVFTRVHCFFPDDPNQKPDMIYSLTANGLTTDGSSTVHIYTQTIHRKTQLKTLVGRPSEIRTQSGQNKINDVLTA